MPSPAEILKTFLIDEMSPVVTDPTLNQAWPIYISEMPDQPDECVTVYDTPGTTDGMIHRTGAEVVHPGLQFKIRSVKYTDGWAKAYALVKALTITDPNFVMIGGNAYTILCLKMTSSILPIGYEQGTKRRELFTVNYLVTINELYG